MHQLGIQIFRLLILAQEFGCDALYPIAEVFDIHRHFLIFGKDKRSEYFSDRVERIASKFLRKDEKAEDLDAKLVHWCAKETVFKLFSEEKLMFEDMRVKPFDTMADWSCDVENLKSRKMAHVDFELTMEFVLTYAAL